MLFLPDELQEAVKTAKESISPLGEPSLQSRVNVLRILGDNSATVHENEGYYKRAKLALAGVYKTLYVWDECFSNDKLPHEILKTGEKIFSGGMGLNELEKHYFKLKTYLDTKLLL